jgi:hypothetical protein
MLSQVILLSKVPSCLHLLQLCNLGHKQWIFISWWGILRRHNSFKFSDILIIFFIGNLPTLPHSPATML